MSIEDELLRLAREREEETEVALGGMFLEHPQHLLRQLRDYLWRQDERGRMKLTDEKVVHLTTVDGGLTELSCPEAEFSSGSRLTFNIQLAESQRGWLVRRFRFHLHLAQARSIKMVRIHLNGGPRHDPLTVPRCHLHIDNGPAHIPFPAMNPRLILHLICRHIEPEFGA